MGLLTSRNNSPYAVSKHGVVILSEALYHELAMMGNKNIGVSVMCPGFVRTRIMDYERNRPKELQNKPVEGMDMSNPAVQAYLQFMTQAIDNGMPPQQLADIVFSAIREKKFYIFPNLEFAKPMIQTRMEDILQERNPTPFPDSK
jgi:short-subunit dehydrogenase